MRRRPWSVSKVLAVSLTALTLLGILCGIVIERTVRATQLDQIRESVSDHEGRLRVVEDLDQISESVSDHEGRLRVVEDQVTEIATDVRWIRRGLESHWQRDNPQPPAPSP